MVNRNVLAAPHFLGGPRLSRAAPEWIASRQTERKQSRRTEIGAARRYVSFANRRLMAAKADGQPAALVESSGRFDHAADNCRERRAHLRRCNPVGQFVTQRHSG